MEVENNVAERFDGDAVNGDYHDLPDELNQSRDNGGQDDDGDQDDQQGGNGMVNGLKLPNGRVIKKAKRQAKATSFSEDGGGVMVAPSPGLVKLNSKAAKNLRRSRATGRGLPKKGGAGKGGWGKLGDEIELPWVDPNDPNYDSDSGEPKGPSSNASKRTIKLNTMVPEMSEEDIRKAVEPLLLEYFDNGDCDEVLNTLEEMLLNIGTRRWMVPALAIELALDHKPSHREMTSRLISVLYLKVISQRDIGQAFDFLLRQLSDLILDTPEAPTVIGNFMARCIADDCIPPKFLHSYKGHVKVTLFCMENS